MQALSPLKMVPKMSRNMIGKPKPKNAAAGLRQKLRCSARTWARAMVASLIAGELQVHVLQRRLGDLQALQLDTAGHGPLGQLVQGLGRGFGDHRDQPVLASGDDLTHLGNGDPVGADELDPGLGPLRAQAAGSAYPDHLPGAHDADPVGEVLSLVHVVGGEQDGLAQLAHAAHDLPRVAPCRRVEAGGRLVEEHQLRVSDQREGEIETSLLPTRELLDAHARLLLQADQLDDVVGRERLRVVAAVEVDHLAHREVRLDGAFLQDHADPPAEVAAGGGGIGAENLDTSVVAAAVALEDLDDGGLARAVGTEQAKDLARLHAEADPAHGMQRAVRLAQLLDHDGRHLRGTSRQLEIVPESFSLTAKRSLASTQPSMTAVITRPTASAERRGTRLATWAMTSCSRLRSRTVRPVRRLSRCTASTAPARLWSTAPRARSSESMIWRCSASSVAWWPRSIGASTAAAAMMASRVSGVMACAASLQDSAGMGWDSINSPSAPAATAASASAGTQSARPAAWLGSTITGSGVRSRSTGTAETSRVFRVAVSKVRMPRSQRMTWGLPSARMYSAAASHSS